MATVVSARPFRIGLSDEVLDDLHARLQRTRRPKPLKAGSWDAGTDPEYLDELIRYWRAEYDWRRHEQALNQFSHFTAQIADANVHYIHEPGFGMQ